MNRSMKGYEWLRHYDQEEEGNCVWRLLCHCCATSSSQAHSHEAAARKTMGDKLALLTRLSPSVRICRSFGYCITGGYCCQQGWVFQKDSHHTTLWKWVLQTYALEALNASRLWKQMFHQRSKDNKKHRSTSRHIRCMWLTLIISINHMKSEVPFYDSNLDLFPEKHIISW